MKHKRRERGLQHTGPRVGERLVCSGNSREVSVTGRKWAKLIPTGKESQILQGLAGYCKNFDFYTEGLRSFSRSYGKTIHRFQKILNPTQVLKTEQPHLVDTSGKWQNIEAKEIILKITRNNFLWSENIHWSYILPSNFTCTYLHKRNERILPQKALHTNVSINLIHSNTKLQTFQYHQWMNG